MIDATHNNLNAKVRAHVDDALAELMLLGFETADAAASLMALQSMICIKDEQKLQRIVDFANSLVGPWGAGQFSEL
ncbi:MAG: hypothetical protein O9296_04515 [Novosphingobium sp.]|jgi:hypothetical protein|nr:hypothetical protein [Novosphingobium sp.]